MRGASKLVSVVLVGTLDAIEEMMLTPMIIANALATRASDNFSNSGFYLFSV